MKQLFAITAITLLLTSCGAHKYCGDTSAKKPEKYSSKRYRNALMERDSLCNLTKTQQNELTSIKAKYDTLNAEYEQLQASTGNQINNLSKTLGDKQATLNQREARLRELEAILRRRDSILNALHNSVKNALLGFKADELSVYTKNGKVYISMSDKLLFKSGDATIEMKGREALQKLAVVLNKSPEIAIAIEGHTDNVPIKTAVYKDNWDLSAARANNVVRILVNEYAMNPTQLSAVGRGEFFPVADNSTTEGKAKNRRTDVVLSPNLEELMKLINVK